MTERGLRVAIAALALAGVAIAAYLTYLHYADVKAFCVAGGGGCEKVRTSDYAKLAGIPVALLGLVVYVLVLASLRVSGEAGRATGVILALAGFGFSAYLTYRELFTIDAGAEDVAQDENVWEIVTAPSDLQTVRGALEGAGVELQNAELTMRPSTTVELDEAGAGKVLRLIEALDDQDDVNAVHANFEADAEVLERAAATA